MDAAPFALLRAEAVARAALLLAPPDGADRHAACEFAFRDLARLVRREIETPTGGGTWGAFLNEKVASATEPENEWGKVDLTELDAALAFARAGALINRDVDAPGREEARRLLDHVINANADPVVRETAMWTLGIWTKAADLDRAMTLVRLIREFPTSARAHEAVMRADGLLRSLTSGNKPGLAESLALQRELIARALALTPPAANADTLRSLLVWNLARDRKLSLDANLVERVLNDLPGWEAGQAGRQVDARSVEALIARAATPEVAAADRARIAKAADAWAQRAESPLRHRFRLIWAEALLEQNDAPASLAKVNEIGTLKDSSLTEEERVRARLTLGRAQRGAGQENDAFGTFRQLTDDLDHDPAPGGGGGAETRKRPDAFWAAWAEMLEILQKQNQAGDRTPTIRLQINRLTLIDRSFGPEPWSSRIGKIRDSLP